jgi:phage terminase large subunit-like protein
VNLRTGAEVLFRSADQPDRLRGPNLSGVWLDEASLMPEEAFAVTIGRLRQGGEQGWLSATFTPKGKKHWTFKTFAGKPGTALFRARTRDNPFLPRGFHDTVKRQYGSALALQELNAEFIEFGGTFYKSAWWKYYRRGPDYYQLPDGRLVPHNHCWRFAVMDPAGGVSEDADYTAICVYDVTPDQDLVVAHAEKDHVPLEDIPRGRSCPACRRSVRLIPVGRINWPGLRQR